MLTLGMYGNVDFYDIKGALEALFQHLRVQDVRYAAVSDNPSFHPGRTAKITAGGAELGIVGEIHPNVCKNFEIGVPCYVAEISFDALYAHMGHEIKYKHLPKFPAVTRDIAVLVDKAVPVAALEDVMKKRAGKLLDTIQLFDVYEGDRIPADKKSVAYAISFRAADRSLTGEEVNAVMEKIVKNLESDLGAQLRQ